MIRCPSYAYRTIPLFLPPIFGALTAGFPGMHENVYLLQTREPLCIFRHLQYKQRCRCRGYSGQTAAAQRFIPIIVYSSTSAQNCSISSANAARPAAQNALSVRSIPAIAAASSTVQTEVALSSFLYIGTKSAPISSYFA